MPAERLQTERGVLRPVPLLRPPLRDGELRKVDRLGMVRFGSGRYAVPEHLIGEDVEIMAHDDVVVIRQAGAEIIRHTVVGPGEVALGTLGDAHRSPTRGVRPRTAAEVAFLGLGPAAETFLRNAAAAGTLRLEHELREIAELEAVWGRTTVVRALERATRFRRFKAADVRAILLAGSGLPTPVRAPATQTRVARGTHPSLERVRGGGSSMSTAAPPLAPELVAGLRRLKLATIRAQAPDVLQTARTQRWPPEDVLRTLVAAEIAARDRTNQHLRLKAANLPVLKRLDDFDTLASGIPAATFAYVASLEWIRARENTLLVGPAGTGKSHVLIGVGLDAVEQGLRVRYGAAADLVEQLYRGLADNTVSRVIDGLLRNDLILIDEVGFAPLDETGTQLLCRLVSPRPT